MVKGKTHEIQRLCDQQHAFVDAIRRKYLHSISLVEWNVPREPKRFQRRIFGRGNVEHRKIPLDLLIHGDD